MKNLILIAILLLLLTPSVLASQEKDIYLDTGGKVGHLIYTENYYSMNNNNLTLDQGRIYFDGIINSSKTKFMIIRPLDTNGNPYSESMIRAYATLDNRTILNTWYGSGKAANENKSQNSGTLQLIGFLTLLALFVIPFIVGFLTFRMIKKLKKK